MEKIFLSILLAPLFVACAQPSKQLSATETIKDRGWLVVGTTGDYAPFSKSSKNSFVGIDIEMAKDLADKLGVKARFVKTSWPSLLNDLKEKKFDLAMSGISKNSKRKKLAFFSESYAKYGKMGIARCDDAKKFSTIEKIDKKATRVIVNPGGTNFSFAKENIKKAKLIVFPNNSEIFQEILSHRADVMISDSIEVYYQAKKHKGRLCPTMPRPITQSEIAILMPKDRALREFVNAWLRNFELSGKKEALFKKYF